MTISPRVPAEPRMPATSRAAASADLLDSPGRRDDVDILRVVASMAVIVLHTAGLLFGDDLRDPDAGASHVVALIGDGIGRFAVPAFFAMAGWGVLVASPPRNATVLTTRILRVLVPMVVWTLVYIGWNALLPDGSDTPGPQLAFEALSGSIRPAFHLWYLYAYLPLLILLGCFALVRAGRSLRVPGLLLLLLAVLPALGPLVVELTGREFPDLPSGPAMYQIIYAVLGAALLARSTRLPRMVWIVVAGAGFLGVLWWHDTIRFPSSYGSLPVLVFTAGVLALLTGVRVPERARPWLTKLSAASFGVYLVHLMLVQALLLWFPPVPKGGPTTALALATVSALVTVAAFALSLGWGRLGLRRLLG